MSENAITLFENVNLGGISESKYQGVENSVAEIVNLDIHSNGGAIKCQRRLRDADSGDIIDDEIIARVPCSDGNAYLFGKTNGKVWRRTTTNLTLVSTISAGVVSAREYNGYIYYATQNNLGRVAVPTSGNVSWSGKDDTWETFANQDANHPMKELNLVLYIGDGHYVAQVDNVTFSDNALDIKKPHRITALGNYFTDLVIGTSISDNKNMSEVVRWNTWSPSYSSSDPIPEKSINAFLNVDNKTVFSAGVEGNLYDYNGSQAGRIKRMQGDFSDTKVKVNHDAVTSFRGYPLFGLSQISGNGVKYGLYSMGQYSPAYSPVTALEYLVSSGSEEDVEIGCICEVEDGFLVTWKSGSTYGLDEYDSNDRATGYIVSRRIMFDRSNSTEYGTVEVAYEDLPDNTSIKIYHRMNNASSYTLMPSKVDAKRMLVTSDHGITQAVFGEIKVELVPDDNDNTPVVQKAIINVKN